MSTPEHSRHQEDVGVYLLGAMSDAEAQAFERHMAHCPSCRDEIERLRPAADALPRAVEQLAPPPTLKASLMEVVEREAEGRAHDPARPARPRRSLAERLRALPGLRPVLVAGALALGVAAGFGVARLSQEDESRTVVATVDERRIPEASARLQLQGGGDDGAILRVQGMPTLKPNRVYQAWVLRDGTIVPQPTFEVSDNGGGAVAIPEDLSDAEQVLVTREQRGGARAPSEEPILAVRL
jgi:anti-sigma-K factor RskA